MHMKKTKTVSTRSHVIDSEESPKQSYQIPKNFVNTGLVILLVGLAFATGVLWTQNKALKEASKNTGSGTGTQAAAGETASPLLADNLKQYAKDLKLDTKKFNTCLDEGKKKDVVKKDMDLGSSLGIQGTPGFFINGKLLGGAFPFELFKEVIDKEIAGTGSENCADYSTELQQSCTGGSFDPKVKEVDLGDSPVKGSKDAKVTIVEFSDFECPFCIRATPTIKQVMDTYGNDIRIVYKHFPLEQLHPHAQLTAQASMCAEEQGKFWDYHDKIFTVQGGSAI